MESLCERENHPCPLVGTSLDCFCDYRRARCSYWRGPAMYRDRLDKGGKIELTANFRTVGVYAYPAGELTEPCEAQLSYRVAGEDNFCPGRPLTRTSPGRFAGSIFHLSPDTPVEVRVTIGEEVLMEAIRARSDTFPAGSGKTYYVAPSGNDGYAGPTERPWRTVRYAVEQAAPGDTIILKPGRYFESVEITRSGSPKAYIALRGLEGNAQLPVITGAKGLTGPWKRMSKAIFVARETRPVNTVRQLGGAGRLYHHETWAELTQADPPLDHGWFQDLQDEKLYVRLPENGPPEKGEITAGYLTPGIRFDKCGYWIVEGVRLEQFGGSSYPRGIDILASNDIVVRNCQFAHMRQGVSVRRADSRNCLIEHNEFVEENIFDWPWDASKSHDVEGAAVALGGAGGNVVRYNRVHGPFNGITASTWTKLHDEQFNHDLDIHHNVLTQIADDPLEPEGACMNVRFWGNRTRNTLTGISLAPITVGPVYVLRDQYVDFTSKAVKVGVKSTGFCYLYHILGWSDRPSSNGIAGQQWGNMHFRNCILRSTKYVLEDYHPHPIDPSFDHSCLYSTDPRRLVKWVGTRIDKASRDELPPGVFGTHLFILEPHHPAGSCLVVRLDSSLIDAGAAIPGVNDDFRGAAPDIGPKEEDPDRPRDLP